MTYSALLGSLPNKVEETEYGFNIIRDDEWTIEIHPMIYNWRIVLGRKDEPLSLIHGYCYFGRGIGPLLRSLAAALDWQDPANTEPVGYDKKAF